MSNSDSKTTPGARLRSGFGSKALACLRLLRHGDLVRRVGTLLTDGYLAETGWVRSVITESIVDAQGRPQPWATLPFIDFLGPRLRSSWTVFEYGAGASSCYFAMRVTAVTAVEHDEAFAGNLRAVLPGNVRLIVRSETGAAYADAVKECSAAPEIVLVDGVDRVRCVDRALARISAGGVVILDDAERPEYEPARRQLMAAGFLELDFWGLAPGRVERKCTSVFYRQENVLGL